MLSEGALESEDADGKIHFADLSWVPPCHRFGKMIKGEVLLNQESATTITDAMAQLGDRIHMVCSK